MQNKALVLVDFQKEWMDENSDYYAGNIRGVLGRVNKLISYCRDKDYKIIFIQHVEKSGEDAFKENTLGVELLDELKREPSDVVIIKNKISAFYKTKLEEELSGIKDIIVGGMLTNLCVRSLIQDAYDRDFEIKVIKDCCVAMDQEIQEFTFKDLKETREEVGFLNLDEFIK